MGIVRRARHTDADAIARVHVDSWRSTYAGILPDDLLLNMDAEAHEARWWRHMLARPRHDHLVFVAEDDLDGVIGFASGGSSRRSRETGEGEIYTLYVDDDFHGEGHGRSLVLTLAEALADRGKETLVVWVLKENPARYFYEDLGGAYVARRPGRLQGADIEEHAFRWDAIDALLTLQKPDAAR